MIILVTCDAEFLGSNFGAHWINELVLILLSKYARALRLKDVEIFA